RHRALCEHTGDSDVVQAVDYRLLGSALSRVEWELDVIRGWQRNPYFNPYFYVHQTLGAIFELLLQPPPFSRLRQEALVKRAAAIQGHIEAARANLPGHAVQPFAELAIGALRNIGPRLETVSRELAPLLDPDHARQFGRALFDATVALDEYRDWLA